MVGLAHLRAAKQATALTAAYPSAEAFFSSNVCNLGFATSFDSALCTHNEGPYDSEFKLSTLVYQGFANLLHNRLDCKVI